MILIEQRNALSRRSLSREKRMNGRHSIVVYAVVSFVIRMKQVINEWYSRGAPGRKRKTAQLGVRKINKYLQFSAIIFSFNELNFKVSKR